MANSYAACVVVMEWYIRTILTHSGELGVQLVITVQAAEELVLYFA
jgi:hypothetical protein